MATIQAKLVTVRRKSQNLRKTHLQNPANNTVEVDNGKKSMRSEVTKKEKKKTKTFFALIKYFELHCNLLYGNQVPINSCFSRRHLLSK